MRSIFLGLLAIVATLSVHAQNSGSVKGKLIDSANKQPLALATITVFKAKDTSIVTYRLSDPQGLFKVPGLPFNIPLRVVISFSGYQVTRKEFTLTEQESQLDLGTLALVSTAQSLDEVLVVAERPPVSVRKDTVEFNASAFKTLPTALVEDLLKKFPGVDVDKEGNITVNGRAVNRILVDGKDFFGGDPKVATRNLPANIIDKVQVTDDQDQLNQDPTINKAQLGQVINLKLRRSIKQGWFGKAYAGAGTDDRYEAGAIVNMFRDTLQVSVLGYTNNLNRAGFGMDDVLNAGGFNRSGYNSLAMSSDGGFAINGISFGGLGQGIVRSTGAGANINNEFGKKVTLNLQYFYGGANNRIGQLTNTQQFFDDTVLTTRSNSRQESDEYTHRIGGNLRWKTDTLGSQFRFEPQISLRKTISERLLQAATFSNFERMLNESNNSQRSNGKQTVYSHNLSYNKVFKNKKRTLYLSNRINIGNNENDQYNDIIDTFYKASPSSRTLNQLRNKETDNFSANLYVNYNQPLSKSLSLRLSNTIDLFKDKDILNTFNKDVSGKEYDQYNEDLSNGLKRSGIRNTTNAGLVWNIKKWRITPGLSLLRLNIDNEFLKNPPIDQQFTYLLPTLNINVNQWNFSYNVNVNAPQGSDLQPVIDNTNTLYQNLGNPELVPTKSHNIYLNYNKYNTKSLTNYNVYVNGTIDQNSVVRERYVDEKGLQITRPINVDGVWSFYGNVNVSKQYKLKSNWQLTLRGGMFGNYNRNIVIVNRNRSTSNNFRINPSASFGFNWNDKLEISQRYSLGWNKSTYDNKAFTNLEVLTHSTFSELVVRLPKHWVWESTFDYTYNPQTAPGVRKSNYRWNAAVNFLFLKDDKGQLKLSVYDLLNQNVSVSRSARENYLQDIQTTVLQRYFLLTFTYNIRNFGAGNKVGGRDRLFFF